MLLPGAEYLGPPSHVFMADEAFPLHGNLMRPFQARWRMDRRVIGVSPDNAEAGVKATRVLHNFLRRKTRIVWNSLTLAVEGEASALQNISRIGSKNASRDATRVRETLVEYFCAEVPWQPQV
ncbi:hypothetical protein R3I94_008822 [Phoxinus phoxinus]